MIKKRPSRNEPKAPTKQTMETQAQSANAQLRMSEHQQQNREAEQEALQSIEFVSPGKHETRRADPEISQPIEVAFGVICQHLRVPAPRLNARGRRQSPDRQMHQLLNNAALRSRRVSVTSQLALHNGLPVLAEDRASGGPRVLLPQSNGRWRVVDPGGAGEPLLTPEILDRLLPHGLVFHPSLSNVKTPLQLFHQILYRARPDTFLVMLVILAVAALNLLLPVSANLMFNHIVPAADLGLIYTVIACLAVLFIGVGFLEFARSALIVRVQGQVDLILQSEIWSRILNMPVWYFHKMTVGGMATRVFETEQLKERLVSAFLPMQIGGAGLITNLGLMAFFDWRFAASISVSFGVITGILVALVHRTLKVRSDEQVWHNRSTERTMQMLAGIAKIRVCGIEPRAFQYWVQALVHQRRSKLMAKSTTDHCLVLVQLFPTLLTVIIFVFASEFFHLSFATFIVLYVIAIQFFTNATLMMNGAVQFVEVATLFSKIEPVLQAPAERVPAKGELDHPLHGGMELVSVSYQYDGAEAPALSDISIGIEPGQFVAIVGPSGSGKSTLIRLLLGFDMPDSGAIYYDGKDLAQLDLNSLRRQIGTVLQHSKLVPGPIIENIIGGTGASTEDARRALQLVGLMQEVESLPMGLFTYVSDDSESLSGGQIQRLLIARALVAMPKILLFDEATSGLDNETQKLVTDSLASQDITRLVIAHRLSTVKRADKIVVLDQGRVVQAGPYQDLIAEPGTFKSLIERQLV